MEKLRPKKMFGQNFLTDRSVLARIVEAVDVDETDRILEIGPGKGALTSLLAKKAALLVAVEVDRDLAALLRRGFAGRENVEIIESDILKADLPALLQSRWKGRWKAAANLPYNISSQVLFRFLDDHALFSELTLMLQKEVGERIAAGPGCKEYGILSVLCALHFDVRKLFIVRPGAFHPVPKVDSIVLKFTSLPAPRLEVGDEPLFRRLVKAAFSQRRKTLWNCLKGAGFTQDEQELHSALGECGIDPGRRGETLSLGEFAHLSRVLTATGRK